MTKRKKEEIKQVSIYLYYGHTWTEWTTLDIGGQ